MKQSFRRMVEGALFESNAEVVDHNNAIHKEIDNHQKSNYEYDHINLAPLVKSHMTNERALTRSQSHPDLSVRRAVLQTSSPHLNKEHINFAMGDPHPEVRSLALNMSNLHGGATHEQLHDALRSNHIDVQKAALKNKNIDKSHLGAASKSIHPEVRKLADSHPLSEK